MVNVNLRNSDAPKIMSKLVSNIINRYTGLFKILDEYDNSQNDYELTE